MDLIFITDENSLGRLGPSDRNRTVTNKIARESKRETDDDLEMFGDDPDPSVVTVRFGFGEVSGEQARGRALSKEIKRPDKRDSKNPVGLRTDNGETRQL